MSNMKKVGPPIPPRPTATQVASALTKSRSCSPTVSQSPIKSGRTVIYKSPSLDEKNSSTDSLKNQNQVSEVSRAPIPKPRLISPVHTINKSNCAGDLQSHLTTVDENKTDSSRTSLQSASIEVKSTLKSVDLSKVDSTKNGEMVSQTTSKTTVDLQTIEFTNQFMDEMLQSMSKNKALSEKLPLRPEPEGKEELSNREGSDTSTSDSYISACSTQNNTNSIKSSLTILEKSFEEKLSEKKSMFSEMLISEIIAKHPPVPTSPSQKVKTTVLNPSKSHRASLSNASTIETPPKSHSTPKSSETPSPLLKRERFPSISSSSNDVSPQGTQRSPRIRTSDWIELGDNGKEIVMTSCHISLEDSGMEDEERLDDASSGVGDSWDSVKDSDSQNRYVSIFSHINSYFIFRNHALITLFIP